MKSFNQFLTEGRDAPLFHSTSLSSARFIIDDNVIKDRTIQKVHPKPGSRVDDLKNGKFHWKNISGVSLTRNIKFANWFGWHVQGYNTLITFELDQTKLAQNYRIQPFNFHSAGEDSYAPGFNARTQDRYDQNKNESEEFIFGPIKNLDKYLLKIHVMSPLTLEHIDKDPEYARLKQHPKLWDSTNARQKGTWLNA